ncbi:hypothetical protein M513_12355 [Trichuris suis]|uniref:Uncharacterized protein n=1 Tax=Trichuris suis TaxID=68888 RepID=A0A085LP78_9BILA|nr:hypothetical protein M513_12355 [Trichuris suis]
MTTAEDPKRGHISAAAILLMTCTKGSSPPHELTQPRSSANPNFASASPPGASPPRLVAIPAPPDGHLRCAEAHLDALDDAVVMEDR